MKIAPALFVGHGSPMFALETETTLDNGQVSASHILQQYRHHFDDVKAIVVVSAHWLTRGITEVTSSKQPETIHDFGGFPDELYQLRYPALGDANLAAMIVEQLSQAGITTQLNAERGLDHGVWVPLIHLVPKANIPVVQVSIDFAASPQALWQLGQQLSSLRQQGIVLIGSGSLTHNLRHLHADHSRVTQYALTFQQWIRQGIQERSVDALIQAESLAPHFKEAHPSSDHFLPLLFALGASQDNDQLEVLDGGMYYGALSMESYLWQTTQN